MLNFIKSKCGLVIFFPLEILLVSWIFFFFCILYFRYGLFIFLPFYIKNSSPNSEVFYFVVGLYLALLQYWIIIVLICTQWSSETITMGLFFLKLDLLLITIVVLRKLKEAELWSCEVMYLLSAEELFPFRRLLIYDIHLPFLYLRLCVGLSASLCKVLFNFLCF